jgi:hypothetical protein
MSGTKPTPGVTITLTGDASDSVVTDANGEFSFDLPDGSYVLTPSKDGHQFSPASANVEVSGADDTGNDFTAEGVYTLSGTITGDVVEGVTITLTGDASDSTTTDENGDYSFTLPDGSFNVEPSLEGYTFAPTDTDVTISGADDTDNDFVSTSLLALPLTIGWNLTDDVPASGPTEAWNVDDYENGVSIIAPITKHTYTPSDYTGSLTLSTLLNTDPRPIYRGFAKNGQTFDMAQGLRVMALVTLYASDAYSAKYKALAWGLYVYNDAAGHPVSGVSGDGIGGYVVRTDPGPDKYDCDQWINGTVTSLASGSEWTGDVSDRYFPHMAIGLEIGANFSGVKMRVKSLGTGEGAKHNETKTLTNPSGDWSGVTLDTVEIRMGYSQLSGTDHTDQIHWLWIGTASDDWPV